MIPTCRELIEFLDDYVERRLPAAKRVAFGVHLLGCRECRAYLRSYRRTIALAKESGKAPDVAPMPEDLTRAILKAMREEESQGLQ